MGQLPQQLDANLRILEQLQQQLRTTSENIRAAEDRSIIFQGQIEQLKRVEPRPGTLTSNQEGSTIQRTPEDPLMAQWNILKRELASGQSKYKDTHPDVIDLKKKIATLEAQNRGKDRKLIGKEHVKRTTVRNLPPPRPDPEAERLYTQYTEQYNTALLEAKRLKEEEKNLKDQINLYQRRIEETPRREQELVLLTRDYDLIEDKLPIPLGQENSSSDGRKPRAETEGRTI